MFRFAPYGTIGDTRTEFYFGSIAAIFSMFDETLIGTRTTALWYHGLSDGNAFESKNCTITAERLIRNPQKR